MTRVDPRFRQMGQGARRRRRRGLALRTGAGLVVFAGLAVLTWPRIAPQVLSWLQPAPAATMVQVETEFDIAPVVRVDTFADIPGDPLIIPAPQDNQRPDMQRRPAPAALAASRRLPAPAAELAVLDSRLIAQDRQLVAALPSTREEFALFQAERGRGRLMTAGLSGAEDVAGVTPEAQRASSGIAFLRDAVSRVPLWRELILETTIETRPEALLAANGFSPAQADRLGARLRGQLELAETLPAGAVLALRYRPQSGLREVIQLTLYDRGGYVGSLALSAAGQLVPGADAWADQPLLQKALAGDPAPASAGQQRLLDVIYSAALRNEVPTEIIGEALALMSQVYDLDGFADARDRLELIYAAEAAGRPGAVMFVGVSGPSGEKRCYVVPAEAGEGFECYAPGARVQMRGTSAQLQPPVGGVLSQRFVPPSGDAAQAGRGQVAWTVPPGNPVLAAGAGSVILATGDRVEIAHEDGLVSRYIGLAALAPAIAKGAAVARGAVIGETGQMPGQEQPELAFMLLEGGRPVDPMPYFGGGTEALASDSIESLIGHIIRVESAGNASAKNPRSTATGLGQFIESTWLRMLRSYRPDLIVSLSRAELLDLRLDPDMSRQMVRHLAQENEGYLRARGHAISAGRLYLAHFLGPAGADQALRAHPAQSVDSVMGAAVVSANPFLRGWSIAQLQNWAERKMSGSAAMPAVMVVPETPASPLIRAFMADMDGLRGARKG
ncbi:M23 family metallopeptidase [Paracoccus lutimaris]|uniref:Peptidase M23-like protein n=1 Tax=Paracoccus lutimaris TaxID=1490030 RepID=A0A368Z3L7_9RHOB|nr:M23 family metallopeptidase [Paracoccus lutimaris]RCW87052.1 peptidase M23-like protein [Paracoccus lutimaris]